MFVALRDMRFAKGRFALMGGVVALITLLVVLLSGLTSGLGRANISAIEELPADHLVFAAGDKLSFADSELTARQVAGWQSAAGSGAVSTLGIGTGRLAAGGKSVTVAEFAVQEDSVLPPAALRGGLVLSTPAATDLGVAAGDRVRVGDTELTVTAVTGDQSYSHLPVAWIPAAAAARPGVTVLAVHDSDADLAAIDARLATRTVPVADSLSAIGSYTSENGSLQLMRAMLLAISALVIGAFFMVWTVQRTPEIAIVKAIGGSSRTLLIDALGQALILLLAGTAVGAGIAAAIGAAAARVVPFVLDAGTVLLPAGAMVLLGLAGAALSLRQITGVDPLTALGAGR